MPHASLRLLPGVDQNRTPTLNEAGISQSQLVRFIPDRENECLVQKLGGWTNFYNSPLDSTVLALNSWHSLNDVNYLGVGAVNSLDVIYSPLDSTFFTNMDPSKRVLKNITPTLITVNPPVNFSTTSGSSTVTITDVASNTTNYDSVLIATQVSIGGLILQGLYQCIGASADTYKITAVDTLGNPLAATSSTTTAYTPFFTTTNSSFLVTVTFENHGYSVGSNVSFLIPTTVGGITIFGNYTVISVVDANNFTINGNTTATSSVTSYPMNNGLAQLTYYKGIGPAPAGTGYGIDGYGSGGYGGTYATLPVTGRQMATIGAEGTGTIATLSYSTNTAVPVGSNITVSSVTPTGYNATATVLSSQSLIFNTVSVATSGGTATITHDGSGIIPVGTVVTISGVTPSGYNGNFTVTGSTATTVSFANSTTGAITVQGIVESNTLTYANTTTGAQTVSGTITINTLQGISGTLDWALDNWGEIFMANPLEGAIYQWPPSSGEPIATVIPQAPIASTGMFVAMPQRQIIAYGTTFNGIVDHLLIRWSDVNNYNSWIGTVNNQAGSYRIPRGSKIVGGIQGPQQGLLWTDLGCWAMQYTGPPFIYSFNEIGTGCGLVGQKAVTSMNGVVYWMSQSQFYMLGPNGPQPILCPIWDVIFQDLDTSNLELIRACPNSRFGEIAWHYPTLSSGGQVTAYAKYNIYLNCWDFGVSNSTNPDVGRTAWINQSVFGPPIGAAQSNNFIYQHETGLNAGTNSMLSSFQTGYFEMQDGDLLTFIDQFWPDAKWGYYAGTQNANLLLTFYVTNYAGDTPIAYGPYTLTQATEYITPRLRGRLVSIQVQSSDSGTFWRLGRMRYRYQADGKF